MRYFIGCWFVLLLAAQTASAQVVINEVLFMPDPASADAIRTHQWLELYNGGADPVDLTNWVVSGRDASAGGSARGLPAVSLPGGGYLVVHFATGQNQLDLSNGSGDYYTGDDPGTPVWDAASDEAALYSDSGIVDFVAWSTAAEIYTPGAAAADAAAAQIWPQGSHVTASFLVQSASEPARSVSPGLSIARDGFSTDT